MTAKLFWKDPYCRCHPARVTWCEKDDIKLDATIFFAFSGGQESDRGTIGGVPVLAARKDGLDIIYTLGPGHGLSVGQEVLVAIDWERRYRLMRLHFAAELVLELCLRTLDGVSKIGAHIAADKARLDFAWPESIAPLLPQLAERANRIIRSDATITTGFEDEAAERRYWLVEGLARVPCGGTHVRRTGEVGLLRLKRNNIGKGKERVEIFLLDPAGV